MILFDKDVFFHIYYETICFSIKQIKNKFRR